VSELTLQQLIERFRELDCCVETISHFHHMQDAAVALARHITEHGLPSWQDRPTCDGIWADGEDGDLFRWESKHGPWEWRRVFGPIPPDTQRKDGDQ
jgi:hypothetical protein